MNINKMKPFAHRGLHSKTVGENSIVAFKNAIKENYNIELDIRITRDNQLVVLHDRSVKGLIGQDLNIEDIKYNELKNYSIPLLEDVFKLIDNKKTFVLLEIKESSLNKELRMELLNLLKIYHERINFAIISFDPRIVRWFKQKGCPAGQSFQNFLPVVLFDIYFKGVNFYSNPDFLIVEKSLLKKRTVKSTRKNKKIISWTIKIGIDDKKYEQYADGYIFDR